MFKLINKETKEVERISNDRFFYDEKNYDLVEFDKIDNNRKLINQVNLATTIDDLKIILKKIIKDL